MEHGAEIKRHLPSDASPESWITSLTSVPFIAVLGRDLSSALAFQ